MTLLTIAVIIFFGAVSITNLSVRPVTAWTIIIGISAAIVAIMTAVNAF